MYHTYILQSISNRSRFYIGASGNSIKRLTQHNRGESASTKPYIPWEIIYQEEFKTKTEAMKREFYLKTPKGYLEKRSLFDKYKK